MRLIGDRLGILVSFGLTEAQAKTYLVLLEYPSLPMGALAKAVQLPRNRVYEIMEQLEEMGLAESLVDSTRRVRAKPIEDFLDSTTSELETRADSIRAQREALAIAFEPKPQAPSLAESGLVQALSGRRVVARTFDRLVSEAHESLVVSGSVGGSARLMRHLSQMSAEQRRRIRSGDLRLEIYLPRAGLRPGGLERLFDEHGAEVRLVDAPLATLLAIADGKEALLVHPIPDDDRQSIGGDKALLCTGLGYVADQLALLRASGVPLLSRPL